MANPSPDPVQSPRNEVSAPCGVTVGLVLLTLVMGVIRYLPVLDEPWGRDPASGNGLWYQGQPVLNWVRLGFSKLHGIPMLGALPTEPPVGAIYAHHPPTVTWMVYGVVTVLGLSERSIRVLPIAFSALTGALLVLLAARWGTRCAATVALLWLVLPMSYVYGVMCNPEAPTLFFIVLTVVLHRRLRAARPSNYGLVILAHFLAGQMDWEGHFTVPALGIYEIARPRGDRRLGRIAALAVTSLASAAVVLVIHGYFKLVSDHQYELLASGAAIPGVRLNSIAHYFAEGLGNARTVARASVTPDVPFTVSYWLRAHGTRAVELFTWPAAIMTAAGLVLTFVRRTDPLWLGTALLVPGILNIVVFSHHSTEHDYWQYYAAPGVVLLTVEVLRRMRPALVVWGLLLAIGVFSALRIHERMTADRTDDDRNLAAELDRFLEPDEILVVDVRFIPATFYARHWLLAEVSSAEVWEHMAALTTLKKAGRITRPLSFLIVPVGKPPPLEDLERYGTLQRLEAVEVQQRFPTIARVYSGPIWFLRPG